MATTHAIEAHFENRDPRVRATYDRIVDAGRALGPMKEDPKKTSIHLVRRTAFAGVATRRATLILTLKSEANIRSPRVMKREQVSANRWHVEVRVEKPSEVDRELKGWLKAAYALSG